MSRAFATALLAELDDDGLDLLASVWRRGSRPARAAGRPPTLTAGEAAAYLGPTANALRELGSAGSADDLLGPQRMGAQVASQRVSRKANGPT